MPLYRLTFKGDDGETTQIEILATNFPASFQCQRDIFHLIRIERINRINGQVMVGTYKEQRTPTVRVS